jgi:site-specific DNA recombinase
VHATLADVTRLAIIYLRISEDRTGLEAGVTRQREDCESRCVERGWRVVSVETDNDQSASTSRKRPGFVAVLAAVESGSVSVVVAWALDRLQRNRKDEIRLYEACQAHGVMLSLVKGNDLEFGTAAGRFVADSLGSVARMEVGMKSERQQRANEQAAKAGRRVGGRRPFGYEPDGATVREHEAHAVRDGYRAVLTGVTLGEIAREWNRRGLVTGQARWKGEHAGEPSPWRRDSVRAVLLNPRYTGLRAHRGEIVGAAAWPALVDESTWHAVHAVLTDPKRTTSALSGTALLTGLGRCGVCKVATVHAGGAALQQKGSRIYRCAGGTGSGAHVARRAEPVEQFVEAVIVERLSRPDARDLLTDHKRPDIDELRTQATALRARLDSLAVEFADGALTASQLRAATERMRANLADVEAAMADAGRVDVLGPLVTSEDVRAVWDSLSTARKRQVIDVLATVTIHPPGRGSRIGRDEAGQYDLKRVAETVEIDWRTT